MLKYKNRELGVFVYSKVFMCKNTLPRIKIFVAYHKKAPIIKDDNDNLFQPIHVGKSVSNINLGIPGDNTGQNISGKNHYYCELTLMYWAWKNLDLDYYGFFHYRRFFDFLGKGRQHFHDFKFTTRLTYGWNKYVIIPYIDDYDIILPPIWGSHLPESPDKLITVRKMYNLSHRKSDLDKVIKIIKNKYSEYYHSALEVLNSKECFYFNMFIMKKYIFKEYMAWLFNILFELERQIRIPKNKYQKRLFGFLAERLLNVFIFKKKQDSRIKLKHINNIVFGYFDMRDYKMSLFNNI